MRQFKIYHKLETEIDEQKNSKEAPILFVGTPCQVRSVKSYLAMRNIRYSKLYYCDLICHGVPRPGVLNYFISKLMNNDRADIVTFKDKTLGWNQPIAFVKKKKKR